MAGSVVSLRGLILGLGLVAGVVALPGAPRAEPPDASRSAEIPPPPPATNAPTPEQVEAIAKTQKCLADLGYYQGAVDGKRGKQTWTAFWNFKQEHGLKSYSDLLAEPVQQKLTELCAAHAEAVAAAAARADPLYQPEDGEPSAPAAAATEETAEGDDGKDDEAALAFPQSEDEPVVPVAPSARLDIDCLPQDLIAVLQRAQGPGRWVTPCERSCLPSPRGLAQRHLDELQAKNGVVWCRACVPIEGRLALEDVRRIEEAGNLQLCATPPRKLARYGEGAADGLRSYMRVRELYRGLPPGEDDPDAFAVVIGNRSYDKLPRSASSYNDADAIYSFLTEHLGYRPDNIIDLRDANKAEFDRVFGAEPGEEGDMERLVEGQPNAKLLIYYSGHGATDEGQNEVYLLPVDSVPHREDIGGYKLWYDAGKATLLEVPINDYSLATLPSTVDQALNKLKDEYQFTPALSEFMYIDINKLMTADVISGAYFGISKVMGTNCHHLVFVQKDIDWQIWIEDGKRPVPRKLVITYKNVAESPQFIALIKDWVTDKPITNFAFKPEIPDVNSRVEFNQITGNQKFKIGSIRAYE